MAFENWRPMGGLASSGGGWQEWFGTMDGASTGEIELSVKNTRLPGVKVVAVMLEGVTARDVLLTEAKPGEAEAKAAR